MSRALACLALLASLSGCASGPSPEQLSKGCPVTVSGAHFALGSQLEISVCAPDRPAGESILRELFAQMIGLERMLSRFDPKSDLVRVNRNAGGLPVVVDPHLLDLVVESLLLKDETHGAFDVVIGQSEIDDDRETSTVLVVAPGASLDFENIERGFALDRLASELAGSGVSRALLAFDQSHARALGKPTGWDGWGVLLADTDGAFIGTAQLDAAALAVAGSLKGKQRVAVVWAAEAARADALATALLRLGETDGIALLESLADAEGLLIDANGKTWQTAGFAKAAHYSAEWPGDED